MVCCLTCKKCSMMSIISIIVIGLLVIVGFIYFCRSNKTYMEWINGQYIYFIEQKHSPSFIFDYGYPILHCISFCFRNNENITQIIDKL